MDALQTLDAALCQSELHRHAAVTTPREIASWVNEQHIGLDGVALVLPAPEASTSLLVPLSFNLRQAEQLVFSSIELLRELLPQLRRGKKPKRILAVLPWNTPTLLAGAAPIDQRAGARWRTAQRLPHDAGGGAKSRRVDPASYICVECKRRRRLGCSQPYRPL